MAGPLSALKYSLKRPFVSGFKELNNAKKNAKSCTSLNLVICARI